MTLLTPSDDHTLDRTESMLRRLPECGSAEQAAFLIARELPKLVGADWAAFSVAAAPVSGGAADRAHHRLAAAALADGCVYSQGEPPTVAAVPVRCGGAPVGVILIGREAGLCLPQLRTTALFAEHAGALMPSVSLAKTA